MKFTPMHSAFHLSEVCPYQIERLTPVRFNKLPESYIYPRKMLLSHICQMQMLLKISHSGLMENACCNFQSGWSNDLCILTYLDIAEALETIRVTVTRLLGQLQQAGIIRWSRQEQILCDYSEVLLQD
jgi:CRP-like cAMP-binding protein